MTHGRRLQYLLARNGTFIGLGILIVVFTLLSDRFLSLRNAEVIALQVAELGIVAIPVALLTISGAADLSIGSIASMAGVIGAAVMGSTESAVLGIAAALGFGVAAGAINGMLVSGRRLNPIVVTLGTLSVWGGMALFATNGATLSGLPESFTRFGTAKIAGIPLQVYLLVVATAFGWWLLNRRALGRHLYAAGGNERAAYLMGVRVRRVRFLMFTYVGVAAAFAGIMLMAKLQAAPPAVGAGMELQILTVVLLGGVGFAGGTGRVSGVIAGLLFVGVLQNGLVVTGTSQFLQQVFIGATLVLAVALDDSIQRFAHRSWKATDRAKDAGSPAPPSAPAQTLDAAGAP